MIFVSIAAFCDPWLVDTVRDACIKAEHPGHLVFGVLEQDAESRAPELQAVVDAYGATLRHRCVHPTESLGVCWARAAIGDLYGGEEWLLQIDSHMHFEPRWDAQLLEQHAELRRHSARPIITVYPWGFEIEAGRPVVRTPPSTTSTLVMRPVPGAELQPDSATMMFRTEHVPVRCPLPGCHVAGGFLFAAGEFMREVPYDAELYFHGEEQNIALRAWTRGWDIWHPAHIPVYHLYKQPDTAHLAHHWHPEWEAQRELSRTELTERARARLADVLYQRRELGIYGLGSVRSLDDYARLFGIDYGARSIERDFLRLYAAWMQADSAKVMPSEPPPLRPLARPSPLSAQGIMKTLLHVGCGPKRKSQTTRGFNHDGWRELRLDIDANVQPDVTGTMTDMSAVATGSVDAVFSSHNIEHLYPHEVPLALAEFVRVLADDGFAVITCPDLQSVCALVAQDKLTEPAYTSPAGPIAPLDILYGHRPPMARGNLYMAHRCGFTQRVLVATLRAAGFAMVASRVRPQQFDLWAVASKSARSDEEMRELAQAHFPR